MAEPMPRANLSYVVAWGLSGKPTARRHQLLNLVQYSSSRSVSSTCGRWSRGFSFYRDPSSLRSGGDPDLRAG